MSPGGTDEVDRVLGNKDLSQASVLDIGCGIGGAAVHIAPTRQPSNVTGNDIEQNLVNLALELAEKNHVPPICEFRLGDPDPLPFEPWGFRLVFSNDSIIHIVHVLSIANNA